MGQRPGMPPPGKGNGGVRRECHRDPGVMLEGTREQGRQGPGIHPRFLPHGGRRGARPRAVWVTERRRTFCSCANSWADGPAAAERVGGGWAGRWYMGRRRQIRVAGSSDPATKRPQARLPRSAGRRQMRNTGALKYGEDVRVCSFQSCCDAGRARHLRGLGLRTPSTALRRVEESRQA